MPGVFEPAWLLRLQRSAGNAAVTAAIRPSALSTLSSKTVLTEGPTARIQRCARALRCPCGGRCGCGAEKPEAERRRPRASVQRVAADFEVKGRSQRSASIPNSIFFDLNDSSIDPAEDSKLAAFSGTTLSTVTLKGFASEEETGRAALVDARIAAVAARLGAISPGTGAPTKVPDLTSGVGQLDYRNVRRVEILVAGAASSVSNCAAGADIACGPSPNAFDQGFDAATNTLLPDAIAALNSPISATTRTALGLFGGVAKAPQVKAGLQK